MPGASRSATTTRTFDAESPARAQIAQRSIMIVQGCAEEAAGWGAVRWAVRELLVGGEAALRVLGEVAASRVFVHVPGFRVAEIRCDLTGFG